MLPRSFLLILLTFGSVSAGFTQTIADTARSERARREALSGRAMLPVATPVPSPLPVGREALIQEALRASGARRQLQQVLETSLESLGNDKRPEGVSPHEYQQIIAEAFDVQRLMLLMENSISGAVSDQTLADIVRWYRSPLGTKVSTADVKANSPAASSQMQRYASTLHLNPPSQNRMSLVRQMELETQATDKTVQTLLSVVLSIYKGISAAGVVISPPPPDFEQTFRSQVTEPMQQGIILWFLFAYQSLTEPELAGYLAFLKSPSAAAFNNSIWNGMNTAFGDAAQYLGRKLAEKKRGVPLTSR